jgi:hypothetical protein
VKQYGLTYLATPYSKYVDGIEAAFQDASWLAARLLQEGLQVFSPIAHTHPLAEYGQLDPLDLSIWLPLDDAFLKVCDTLFVARLDGWSISKGVAHEIEFFQRARKPIYFVRPDTLDVDRFPIKLEVTA